MTPEQLRRLQQSFSRIEPDVETFGALFHERLFQIAPEMRSLFRSDLKAQQSKFMKVIAEVVRLPLRAMVSLPVTCLSSGEAMLPGAYWAGKLHAGHGVRIADFEIMKQALLMALDETLGQELTPEIRDAWIAAYDIVARAMARGMKDAAEGGHEPGTTEGAPPEQGEEGSQAFLKMVGKRS